ncbi:MAG: diaminopimelate decarboxylase [Pseudohongiellaceae bacterium]
MDYFNYKDDSLYAEDVSVADIAARFGTPCFVYSRATLERHYRVYEAAPAGLSCMVCYAVKANSNLAVLDVLARLGSGFDIVSGGELERVAAVGGDTGKVIFSGLGKTEAEIRQALAANIYCFNVESGDELERINRVAQEMGKQAPVSIRVNPDVDAGTHPYISTGLKENKFGIAMSEALAHYRHAAGLDGVRLVGIACHIGSQLTAVEPYLAAIDSLLTLVDTLADENIHLQHLDMGGGLGVTYKDEQPPLPSELIGAVAKQLGKRELRLIVEPGRSIAGNAGIFVTRVEYLKHNGPKNFAIVDGAMNDLLRPALYGVWQDIIPVLRRQSGDVAAIYDVVGPVCESADFLGKERALHIQPGDLLAVRTAGAYGFAMSSNYNTRPRAAEVMVDGDEMHLIRARETVSDLLAGEQCLPRA